MKRFPDCERLRKDLNITLSEKNSKIIFKNPQRLEVRELIVDGCAITEGVRCDYALEVESIEEEFYVELKGSDIKHAFEQIELTIQQISSQPYQMPKYCFVISTRNKIPKGELGVKKKKMLTKYNARLIVANREYTHNLEP
jgi:hypothetical protein